MLKTLRIAGVAFAAFSLSNGSWAQNLITLTCEQIGTNNSGGWSTAKGLRNV